MRSCFNSKSLVAFLAAVLFAGPVAADDDALVRMFRWWNDAFVTEGGFNQEAFARYWTEDAALIIDGEDVLTRHFQKIQANTDRVRIELPFEDSFTVGDRIFTHHFIYRRNGQEEGCLRAMGYAETRDGKLSVVNLVRVPYDPETAYDGGCKGAD